MSVQKAFEIAVSSLPEAAVVVEVGSHCGDGVAYILGKRPEAIVHAIEPGIESFAKLHCRHKRSYWLAIGDRTQKKLKRIGSTRQYRMVPGKGDVEQVTLDEFVKRQHILHIDLVRFDCYGSEYAAFRTRNDWLQITAAVCIVMHKQRVVGCDVGKERRHIRGCLMSAKFEQVYSYGEGLNKHVFEYWGRH